MDAGGAVTKEFMVSGRVQGVFFRKFTKAEADKLGLRGFVRNLRDGRVYCVARGPPAEMERFESFLRKGSPKAEVQAVASRPWEGELPTGFEIQRGDWAAPGDAGEAGRGVGQEEVWRRRPAGPRRGAGGSG